MSDLSRHSRAMLLNVLWHHQGGSSEVGQAIRNMLCIGEHERMTDAQVDEAKWIDGLLASAASDSRVPDGTWLWCKLMDWCRKRRFPPAEYNDLFAIVGEARAASGIAATAPAAAPRSEPTAEHWKRAIHDYCGDDVAGLKKRSADWIEQRARELARGDAKEER